MQERTEPRLYRIVVRRRVGVHVTVGFGWGRRDFAIQLVSINGEEPRR